MNFLAHIYLSGSSEEILVGNFIGDYVKGHDYTLYPSKIKKGILLHRSIDSFTDRHPITRSCKAYIREEYGLYSGIVIDIFYDHFLAVNWSDFCRVSLSRYIHNRYEILDSHFEIFPEGVQGFFPYFIRSNWLEAYVSLGGLESVLRRMALRTSLPDHSEYAIRELRANYSALEKLSIEFLREIIEYVRLEHSIKL